MPDSFEVRSAAHSYGVTVADGVVDAFLAARPDAFVVCDTIFEERLAAPGRRVIGLEAVETGKTLEVAGRLIEALREGGCSRADRLVAVGGGIVQDVACFAASIYMRGIPWDYCPTTLLGMVDSCIGGKSSINVGRFKNIAGTFHPPASILVDVDFVSTLPPDQYTGGLCEAAKICFARGPDAFSAYLDREPGLGMGADALAETVSLSLRSKQWFIEIDEFDRNERLTLNFGHTFGHALEAATGFSINHGLGVGIGVLCALDFADRETGIRTDRTEALDAHMRGLVRGSLSPDLLGRLDRPGFARAFLSDKKHDRDTLRLVLPVEGGPLPLARVPFPKGADTMAKVERSLTRVVESLAA